MYAASGHLVLMDRDRQTGGGGFMPGDLDEGGSVIGSMSGAGWDGGDW